MFLTSCPMLWRLQRQTKKMKTGRVTSVGFQFRFAEKTSMMGCNESCITLSKKAHPH